jgi:hypothetical protein
LRIGTAGAFVSAAAAMTFLAAGCGGPLPDLVVDAPQGTSGYTCDNGKLSFTVHAVITNNGSAAVTLPTEWTKPWVTGYPSTSIPGFVKPYQSQGGAAYDLIIQVDPYNVIQESNGNNNTSNIAIPAKICG